MAYAAATRACNVEFVAARGGHRAAGAIGKGILPGDLIGEGRAGTAGCGLAQTSAVLRQGPFAILPERCPPRARIQEIALHMNGPFTVERRIFRPANGWLRVRRGEDLVSFALCLAVIFIGVMLMAQALEQYNRAQVMRAWPTASSSSIT